MKNVNREKNKPVRGSQGFKQQQGWKGQCTNRHLGKAPKKRHVETRPQLLAAARARRGATWPCGAAPRAALTPHTCHGPGPILVLETWV